MKVGLLLSIADNLVIMCVYKMLSDSERLRAPSKKCAEIRACMLPHLKVRID